MAAYKVLGQTSDMNSNIGRLGGEILLGKHLSRDDAAVSAYSYATQNLSLHVPWLLSKYLKC